VPDWVEKQTLLPASNQAPAPIEVNASDQGKQQLPAPSAPCTTEIIFDFLFEEFYCVSQFAWFVRRKVSYPVFTPKPSTHRMHDPGSIVPHIRPKGFTDNQLSRIKYDYYYINSVSKDYDDSQRNGTAEDSITS
jgi:hypothetical protein